jgi:hypothetical protein
MTNFVHISVKPLSTAGRLFFSKFLGVMFLLIVVYIQFIVPFHLRINTCLVEAAFKANWNRQNHPCPSVKKVYMVCISPEQVGKFREYGYEFIGGNSCPLLKFTDIVARRSQCHSRESREGLLRRRVKINCVGSASTAVADWAIQAILSLVIRTDVYCALSCRHRMTLRDMVTAL